MATFGLCIQFMLQLLFRVFQNTHLSYSLVLSFNFYGFCISFSLHMNGKWDLICHLLGAMSGSEQGHSTWWCVFDCCHGSSSCEKRKPKISKNAQRKICITISWYFVFLGEFFFYLILVKMINHSSLENNVFHWRWSLLKLCLKSFYERATFNICSKDSDMSE